MILIISNSKDVTTDYLCRKIDESTLNFQRLDSDKILEKVSIGYLDNGPILTIADNQFHPFDISSVVFRRPKPIDLKVGKDSAEQNHVNQEWAESIEGFLAHLAPSKWLNHPAQNVLASHKMEQLSRAKKFGLLIPNTIVTQREDDLLKFWKESNESIITKPLALGFLERFPEQESTNIYTNVVSIEILKKALPSLKNCPTLFQEAFHKKIDVRITVVDTHCTAVSITNSSSSKIDIRRDNMRDVQYKIIELPTSVKAGIFSLLKSYGLRFAAIDMVINITNGQWYFLEINPNGQWAWMDLVGETKIYEGFTQAFERDLKCNVN